MAKNFNILPNNNINKSNINTDKLKTTDVKNNLKNHLISDINDKSSVINQKKSSNLKEVIKSSNSIPKRRKTLKKNDEFLDYVNKNIRDDNAVLNNPGKFYNGFFNTIMKKVINQNQQ